MSDTAFLLLAAVVAAVFVVAVLASNPKGRTRDHD